MQDQNTTEQGPGTGLSASESLQDPVSGTERRPGGEFGAQTGAEGFHRFDRDPEALAWARAKAQAYIDQLADWTRQADERGATAKGRGIAAARLLAERHFLGGGCTIGAFDERWPGYLDRIDTSQQETDHA